MSMHRLAGIMELLNCSSTEEESRTGENISAILHASPVESTLDIFLESIPLYLDLLKSHI